MRLTITAMCCLLMVAGAAFAQTDRGNITGTVSDPTGAFIPGAAIELKNINTGAVYQAQSSSTSKAFDFQNGRVAFFNFAGKRVH